MWCQFILCQRAFHESSVFQIVFTSLMHNLLIEMESRASGTFSFIFGIIPFHLYMLHTYTLLYTSGSASMKYFVFKRCYRMLRFKNFVFNYYRICMWNTNIFDLHYVAAQREWHIFLVAWWTRGNGIPLSCRCSCAISCPDE